MAARRRATAVAVAAALAAATLSWADGRAPSAAEMAVGTWVNSEGALTIAPAADGRLALTFHSMLEGRKVDGIEAMGTGRWLLRGTTGDGLSYRGELATERLDAGAGPRAARAQWRLEPVGRDALALTVASFPFSSPPVRFTRVPGSGSGLSGSWRRDGTSLVVGMETTPAGIMLSLPSDKPAELFSPDPVYLSPDGRGGWVGVMQPIGGKKKTVALAVDAGGRLTVSAGGGLFAIKRSYGRPAGLH